jgi:hypothetical protein
MAPIRIKFTDFPGPFNTSRILRLLQSKFDVLEVDQDPDYLIYSVFGSSVLGDRRAIRIFFTGENVRPDFNLCDYAFGYDWLEFGDRYYRWPNYQLYEHFKDICRRRRSTTASDDLASTKRRFCNFVYSNPNAIPYRDELFGALGRYKHVDSAGPHLNNMGFSPGQAYKGDWPGAKVEFQRSYKFSIACENSSSPGYTTEKIVHALAADTIPIYFGNPLIAREFNSRRFINCHEYDSLDAVVARVAEIDADDLRYYQMLAEPFFNDDHVPDYLTDDAIGRQFSHIFDQQTAIAYRRSFWGWGRKYEETRRAEVAAAAAVEDVARSLADIERVAEPSVRSQIESLRRQLTGSSGHA